VNVVPLETDGGKPAMIAFQIFAHNVNFFMARLYTSAIITRNPLAVQVPLSAEAATNTIARGAQLHVKRAVLIFVPPVQYNRLDLVMVAAICIVTHTRPNAWGKM
jgi:hypothetical protein